jgi:hypothetical protein
MGHKFVYHQEGILPVVALVIKISADEAPRRRVEPFPAEAAEFLKIPVDKKKAVEPLVDHKEAAEVLRGFPGNGKNRPRAGPRA